MDNPQQPIGLYIHVPFCVSRCTYCDFYSTTDTAVELVSAYVDVVKQAIKAHASDTADAALATIYFGGGTPAMLGRHLTDVLATIRQNMPLTADTEVTVEANPGSLDGAIVAEWVAAGVTRISVGVQSFDEKALAMLGRSHTVADTFMALAILEDLPGSPLSVGIDLLCGVPGVALGSWQAQLEMAIACDVDHLSIYPLTVENQTVLAQQVARGEVTMPDDEAIAAQMALARRMLIEAGFDHYEIANYAKPGRRSRHNSAYWTGVPYRGIGPSAASMLPMPAGGRMRFITHGTLDELLSDPVRDDGDETVDREVLGAFEARLEDLMLGMRLMKGVARRDVEALGLTGLFAQLAERELVFFDCDSSRYRLSDPGWLLGNEVFGAIWDARESKSER